MRAVMMLPTLATTLLSETERSQMYQPLAPRPDWTEEAFDYFYCIPEEQSQGDEDDSD